MRLDGAPWGNIRSVADGVGANSTGLPYLYLPTPDPSAVDLRADNRATISLSEVLHCLAPTNAQTHKRTNARTHTHTHTLPFLDLSLPLSDFPDLIILPFFRLQLAPAS